MRWASCNYERFASVSDMTAILGCHSLERRQADARLCLFYRIVYGMVTVPFPDFIQPATHVSRYCHSMIFQQLQTTRNYYVFIFSRLQLTSGRPCQKLLCACPVLKISRLQLAGCSTPDPRPWEASFLSDFYSILTILTYHLSSAQLSSWSLNYHLSFIFYNNFLVSQISAPA